MTFQVVLTDRAARDLDEAYRWYAERAPQAAVDWYNGFLNALDSLSMNPERCSYALERDKVPVEIRQLLYGRQRSYRAIYLIRAQTVVVLHIRHTARRDASREELFE
jgi:plasmid stabilization system protein ParE